MNKTKKICIVSIGIALYVILSMMVKIPLIGHISVDLGYIVLAVYCYMFDGVSGAIVGGIGCALTSIIAYGMFPAGWFLGNIFIGVTCGNLYDKEPYKISISNIVHTVMLVFVGILFCKTVIECAVYGIPISAKIPKNLVAAICDSIVMSIGTVIAPKIKKAVSLNGKELK